MKPFLILTCFGLMISTASMAEDISTPTETCADGAGTIVTGSVSGHKYCKSNAMMNWWNAHAWRDGLGRRLFSLDECTCSDTTSDCYGKCSDLKSVGDDKWIWTSIPRDASLAYSVNLSSEKVDYINHFCTNSSVFYALYY